MGIISRILNSFIFWGAWIIIPVIMEIVPAIGSILVLRKRRRNNGIEETTIGYKPDITLIIPVYNSQETLGECIRSIHNSTYPNRFIRVFLVDNKGGDESFSVFAECQQRYPDLRMQWLSSEQGKSRALNLALYNSEGKYIINIDSDGQLEPNALVNMIDKFERNPDLNCMTGAVLTYPEQIMEYKGFFPRLLRNLEFMEYAQAFLAGRSYASENNSVYTLSGAFSAFRKSAILSSRMYNTDTICEDTQVTFQMRYIYKERIEICEQALFFVDPIEDVNKLYTQRQRWQRGSLEVGKMFMDDDFKVTKAVRDVNIKTLMYDHTFAFPRMIWYLALLCLMFMNYSGMAVVYSTLLIFVLYIIVGFFYYNTVLYYLKVAPDIRKYYKAHWWCIFLLPVFNFIVFFIRFAGIINSINTDSSWKTRNLTQEGQAFMKVLDEDAGYLRRVRDKLSVVFNRQDVEDTREADVNGEASDMGDRREIHGEKSQAWYSAGWYIGIGIVVFLSAVLIGVTAFVKMTYGVGLNELINTMGGNLTGTSKDVVMVVITKCVVPIFAILAGYIFLAVIDKKIFKKRMKKNDAGRYGTGHRIVTMASAALLMSAILFVNTNFGVIDFFKAQEAQSSIYDDLYVDPKEVAITSEGTERNLIYIYLESMETTYADTTSGGAQDENYMPNLTELAGENISFSEDDKLGGFHSVTGTGYTMGAIFGTTTGVPYALPVDSSAISNEKSFASGITSLGDILAEKGYTQEFLCGSDGAFGGRKMYFEQHGGYQVFDLYTAREQGYIPNDYFVWWGFEDQKLFSIAKEELTRLAAGEQPFNFTMLTVDTHHLDGYECELCQDTYSNVTANVVHCTDRQLGEFISWCKQQPFYENTAIVITGDHPRMDTNLVDATSYYDRTIYNCFINSAATSVQSLGGREFTPLDIFPTVLAAMGYRIEGDRLGLGTNLFSDQKTIAEEKGFDWLEGEFSKSPDAYVERFAPELADH